MSQNIDMFVMGGCLGMGLGFTLGYATRAARSLVQRQPRERRSRLIEDRDPVVPLRARQFARVDDDTFKAAPPESTSDRGDVISALQGLGFKKTDATRAADSCSLAERALGGESWTRAALQKAAR